MYWTKILFKNIVLPVVLKFHFSENHSNKSNQYYHRFVFFRRVSSLLYWYTMHENSIQKHFFSLWYRVFIFLRMLPVEAITLLIQLHCAFGLVVYYTDMQCMKILFKSIFLPLVLNFHFSERSILIHLHFFFIYYYLIFMWSIWNSIFQFSRFRRTFISLYE